VEARPFRCDRVRTDGQQRRQETPVITAEDSARVAGFLLRDGDGRAGNGGTRTITNGPQNGSGGDLGCHGNREHSQRDDDGERERYPQTRHGLPPGCNSCAKGATGKLYYAPYAVVSTILCSFLLAYAHNAALFHARRFAVCSAFVLRGEFERFPRL